MYKEINKDSYYKVRGDLLSIIDKLQKCIEQPYKVSTELPYYLGKFSAMYEKSYIEEIEK